MLIEENVNANYLRFIFLLHTLQYAVFNLRKRDYYCISEHVPFHDVKVHTTTWNTLVYMV